MDDNDDGGAAFPFQLLGENGKPWDRGHKGMTLRDWFAGQALAGINANQMFNDESWDSTAEQAYLAADAMIKARGQ